MAPLPPPSKTKPSARTLRLQRITGQIHPLLPAKTFRPDASVTDAFLTSKRDKRLMKHSSFVSRVTASSGVSKTKPRRQRQRRPGNKLRTDLDGLADALPELSERESRDPGKEGRVRHRSLVSKRGALRRKEIVVRGEMDRFGASMARLAGVREAEVPVATSSTAPAAAASPSSRWAALRGYISSTVEQNPAFAQTTAG